MLNKNNFFKISFSIIIFLSLVQTNISFASTIHLDGYIDDWNDKPILYDDYEYNVRTYNNIYSTSWFTDENNFYIKIERYGYRRLKSKWTTYANLFYANKKYKLEFNYYPKTRKVYVKLFDITNSNILIWADNGRWGGRGFNKGFLFEAYAPLEKLVGNTTGGYELRAVIHSSNDRSPDYGRITIASLTTLSILLEILLGLFGILIIYITHFKKGKSVTILHLTNKL
ncbi:hypothetical protein [Helicovermis profundi]|uniref:Uncharacterized protein n=1 Tax=Helicovermis profundi TaxID=3065157 RepID=A0AAU9E0K0_9FIRM|nr:hypothetical protein HLPR_01220 [Clostridia bacterium S502]